jgi:transcriptional activator HAC1
VRPAVSVGRATALDGFNDSHDFSHLSNLVNTDGDFASFLEDSTPTESDHQFYEDNVAPLTDDFKSIYDHSVGHDGDYAAFNMDEFLNHDDPHTSELRSSDLFAETTASLQPQFGASSYGCDDGGNAVSV